MHVYPNYYKKTFYFFSLSYMKNGEKNHRFSCRKDHKKEFYSDDNKKIFKINDINSEILSSKRLFPEIIYFNEYIIGYKHNYNIKSLYIKLPEYVCSGNELKKNITISSEINDTDFFGK